MDYNQALEVLNNLRSVLYEKGEITVTPKVYRQVEEAVLEISMALDRQEEQLSLLSENVEELRTSRDKLKEDLREINDSYITTVAVREKKKVKKKK